MMTFYLNNVKLLVLKILLLTVLNLQDCPIHKKKYFRLRPFYSHVLYNYVVNETHLVGGASNIISIVRRLFRIDK